MLSRQKMQVDNGLTAGLTAAALSYVQASELPDAEEAGKAGDEEAKEEDGEDKTESVQLLLCCRVSHSRRSRDTCCRKHGRRLRRALLHLRHRNHCRASESGATDEACMFTPRRRHNAMQDEHARGRREEHGQSLGAGPPC